MQGVQLHVPCRPLPHGLRAAEPWRLHELRPGPLQGQGQRVGVHCVRHWPLPVGHGLHFVRRVPCRAVPGRQRGLGLQGMPHPLRCRRRSQWMRRQRRRRVRGLRCWQRKGCCWDAQLCPVRLGEVPRGSEADDVQGLPIGEVPACLWADGVPDLQLLVRSRQRPSRLWGVCGWRVPSLRQGSIQGERGHLRVLRLHQRPVPGQRWPAGMRCLRRAHVPAACRRVRMHRLRLHVPRGPVPHRVRWLRRWHLQNLRGRPLQVGCHADCDQLYRMQRRSLCSPRQRGVHSLQR